jgi:hypothetical protein
MEGNSMKSFILQLAYVGVLLSLFFTFTGCEVNQQPPVYHEKIATNIHSGMPLQYRAQEQPDYCVPACIQMYQLFEGTTMDPQWLIMTLCQDLDGVPGMSMYDMKLYLQSCSYISTDFIRWPKDPMDQAAAYLRMLTDNHQTPVVSLGEVHMVIIGGYGHVGTELKFLLLYDPATTNMDTTRYNSIALSPLSLFGMMEAVEHPEESGEYWYIGLSQTYPAKNSEFLGGEPVDTAQPARLTNIPFIRDIAPAIIHNDDDPGPTSPLTLEDTIRACASVALGKWCKEDLMQHAALFGTLMLDCHHGAVYPTSSLRWSPPVSGKVTQDTSANKGDMYYAWVVEERSNVSNELVGATLLSYLHRDSAVSVVFCAPTPQMIRNWRETGQRRWSQVVDREALLAEFDSVQAIHTERLQDIAAPLYSMPIFRCFVGGKSVDIDYKYNILEADQSGALHACGKQLSPGWRPADDHPATPRGFDLGQNYPNPFNPSTMIEFTLPVAAHAKVAVFNVLGQRVKTLIDGDLPVGRHTVVWDGTDERGSSVASGVYLYRLWAGDFSESKKMILQK